MKNDKDELDMLYEKQMLKCSEDGYVSETKPDFNENDFEKLYKNKRIKLTLFTFLITFVLSLLLSLIIHAVIFYGADFAQGNNLLLNHFSPKMIILCITASALTTLAVVVSFGKDLLIKLMPDNMKIYTKKKYEEDAYGNFEKLAKPLKIALCIPLILISFLAIMTSANDIGFYDNHLRFSNGVILKIVDIQYDDLKIYKVLNVRTKEGELKPVENNYVIAGKSRLFYELGRVDENSELHKILFEIVENYNTEITEISEIDSIYELL